MAIVSLDEYNLCEKNGHKDDKIQCPECSVWYCSACGFIDNEYLLIMCPICGEHNSMKED